jgi:predicted DNA-binding transcriptional regulator AlpA
MVRIRLARKKQKKHVLRRPAVEGLLTSQEAAEALGVSQSTLDHWRAKAFGPSFLRCGHRIYYRRSELMAWLDKQVVACGQVA